jgi:hypothetical protein
MMIVFVLHFPHQSGNSFIYIECGLPDPWENLQIIWPVLAIQTFTPPKRLVLFSCMQKSSEEFVIVRKSHEENVPKKFSIV